MKWPCIFLFMSACMNPAADYVNKAESDSDKISNYSFEIYSIEDSLFGYRIFENSQILIEQKNIPALQGNIGFSDSSAAAGTAKLVVSKLKKGMFPPTLSAEEISNILNKQYK